MDHIQEEESVVIINLKVLSNNAKELKFDRANFVKLTKIKIIAV